MNSVTVVMIYADKIKFTASAVRVIGRVFIVAGSHHARGVLVFIVLRTYSFFV